MKTLLFAIALTTTALGAGAVHAQPTTPEKPNDPAEAAYQEGKRLYDIQEWDAAIAKFKEAYRLRADQAALFNIAQAQRLKGDCPSAIATYKTYKRNFPNADNLAKVDKFITDLETNCPKPATTGTPTTGTPTTGTPTTGTPTTGTPTTGTGAITTQDPHIDQGHTPPHLIEPPKKIPEGHAAQDTRPGQIAEEDPGKTKRYAGYVLIGVGAVGLIAGTVFAVSAKNHASDVTNGGGTWNPAAERDGEKAQRNSRIGFVVGALAAGAGVTLVILGRNTGEEHAKLAVAPSTDGATLVFGGRF